MHKFLTYEGKTFGEDLIPGPKTHLVIGNNGSYIREGFPFQVRSNVYLPTNGLCQRLWSKNS